MHVVRPNDILVTNKEGGFKDRILESSGLGFKEVPVRRNLQGRQVWDLVTIGLIVCALLWVWRAASVNRDLQAVIQVTGGIADRLVVQDRLVGAELQLPFLQHEAAGDSSDSRYRLLWIVDIERCATCLTTRFGLWNALSRDTSLARYLLVVGQTENEVPGSARRGLRGTRIKSLSREQALTAFGPLLGNTKILVDHTGTVVMADSRRDALSCAWSFEAQVGILRGIFSSEAIRSQS